MCKIFTELKEITLVSDVGSSYKKVESILGMHDFKKIVDYNVISWILNASRKEKRWETDSYNNES